MIVEPGNSPLSSEEEDVRVEEIVRKGPGGAIAVAGTAVVLVLLMWWAFYLFVFVPRG